MNLSRWFDERIFALAIATKGDEKSMKDLLALSKEHGISWDDVYREIEVMCLVLFGE